MSDTVIKVTNVSKKFCRTIKHTMIYGTADLAKSFLSLKQQTEKLRSGEFWAADDVSFELKRGETLGIIGPNGAGKSTMLKMLNGIFMPDKGKIEIKGRVGALIEVGAGFHPMLTGRENIYVNAAILGMRKREIDRKFEEIVQFAGLQEFIDTPVKHYSSGMSVRLGFSIATSVEPDILLVDEVLSVGDTAFQARCWNRITELINSGTAIVLVSHQMNLIKVFCNRCLVMNSLENKLFDDVGESINYYLKVCEKEFATQITPAEGNPEAEIDNVKIHNGIEQDPSIHVEFCFKANTVILDAVFTIGVFALDHTLLFACNSLDDNGLLIPVEKGLGGKCSICIKGLNLNPGEYRISLGIWNKTLTKPYFWASEKYHIHIPGKLGKLGFFDPQREWRINQDSNLND